MDGTRLSEILTPAGDADLSPDEILRYIKGEMEPEERAEIEAFLDVSPVARLDVADARRQLELEKRLLAFPAPLFPKPDLPVRRPRWGWLMPLGLATGVVLAAFFLGRATGRGHDDRLRSEAVALSEATASLDAERNARERLERERGALLSQLEVGRHKLDTLQAGLGKKDAPTAGSSEEKSRLRSQIAAQRASIGRLSRELDRSKARERIQGAVAMRADPETEETRQRAIQVPGERGGEADSLASPPTLTVPPPEARASLEPLPRVVLSLPKLADRVPYEWVIWALKGDTPRRLVPSQAKIEGDQAILTPATPLGAGRYAVGARGAEANPTRSEEERPWHVFRFRVLSSDERARRDAALVWARHDPLAAAMDLYDLGRLGEAASVLETLGKAPRIQETLAGIERWRQDARRGSVLPVRPDTLESEPPSGDVPVNVSIRTDPQKDSPPPLAGDSVPALQKLVILANALDPKGIDRPKRLDLLREAFGMAQRLNHPVGLAKVGFWLLQDLSIPEQYLEAEPYIAPALEGARRAMKAFKPETAPENLPEAYIGVCYFGGSIYRFTGRFPQALDLIHEGQACARERRLPWTLERLNFAEALTYQESGNLREAVKGWRSNLELLATLPENDPDTGLRRIEQYGATAADLAGCLCRLGEYRQAIDTCDQALGQKQPLVPNAEATLLSMRAAARIELGEDAKVEEDLSRAKGVLAKFPDAPADATVEITYGLFHLRRGRLVEAEAHLEKGKASAQTGHDRTNERAAEINLGGR